MYAQEIVDINILDKPDDDIITDMTIILISIEFNKKIISFTRSKYEITIYHHHN